jgi:hypothetical protein
MAMPGQFPQFDQYPQSGGPYPNRPMPTVVRNATTAMFAGGALSVVSALWTMHLSNTSTAAHLAGGFGLFGGVIDLGLWIWMALANRAGHNWARITGTVFFGISTVTTIAGILLLGTVKRLDQANGVTVQAPSSSAVTLVLSVVLWLVALYATVMMWNKSAREFYQPQAQYPPMGWPQQPGMPPQGYPYPYPYPSVPGQPMPPQSGQVPPWPAQPTDPWQQTPQD